MVHLKRQVESKRRHVEPNVDLRLAASEGGRELAVEYLDIDATPDMSFFNAEAGFGFSPLGRLGRGGGIIVAMATFVESNVQPLLQPSPDT